MDISHFSPNSDHRFKSQRLLPSATLTSDFSDESTESDEEHPQIILQAKKVSHVSSKNFEISRELEYCKSLLVPFMHGWKNELVQKMIFSNDIGDPDLDVRQALRDLFTVPSRTDPKTREALRTVVTLMAVFDHDANFENPQTEVAQLFSKMQKPVTWDGIESMGEQGAIRFIDFFQVLDGVVSGQLTNCLLDTEQRKELETFTLVVNAPESPIHLGVRFIKTNVFVDYCGYLKQVVSFEARPNENYPLIHLEGPWKRYQEKNNGIMHNLVPAQIGSPKHVSRIVDEMTGNRGTPSEATIASWRQEFSCVLSTSNLWIRWRKLETTCQIMRCKGGHMVVSTAVLTFKRYLKAAVSRETVLEAAQEVCSANCAHENRLSFLQVVATIGCKVTPDWLRSSADAEIARALYIASS